MSNLLNLSDAINEAFKTGQTPTFIYEGTTYQFSPAGLLAFISANAVGDIPTEDPGVAGEIWNDDGVLKVSEG